MSEHTSIAKCPVGLMDTYPAGKSDSYHCKNFYLDTSRDYKNEYFRLITHCFVELEHASGIKPRQREWDELRSLTKGSFQAYLMGNMEHALQISCRLIQILEQLSRLSEEEMLEINKKAKFYDQKIKGLNHYNEIRHRAQSLARFIANVAWLNDKNRQVRIGKMCELVLHNSMLLIKKKKLELVKELNEQMELGKLMDLERLMDLEKRFPIDAAGLRPWISEVAPAYASKGGRPRKK